MRRFKINEELSVSSVVTDMCKDLSYQLINKINSSKKKIATDKAVLIKKGFFNFDCSKYLKTIQWLNVRYVAYFFESEEALRTAEKMGMLDCSADYQNKNVKLKVGYVNDKPSNDFSVAIRHELKHIYEYDCGMQKNENFYQRVIGRIQNGERWEKIVGWALYLSFKTEQDAFLSQYYEYLKTDRQYHIDSLKDEKNPYCQFDRAFDNVDRLNFTEEQVKQSFGLTINQLYHILESADERLFKKMTHVVQKYHNEEKYNSINPNYAKFMFECFDKGYKDFESDELY